MRVMKKSLNLTIDNVLISKAKKVAASRNISLSSLVEDKLKQATNSVDQMKIEEIFSNFHKKHISRSSQSRTKKILEPSNSLVNKWLSQRIK